ncbi:hypothetical protein [Aliterella atlantica]|uniref:hypothetical protein n=1 Tax=Aliterella atlantica TaxID=1827278 RepID=UPI0005D3EDFF|nr:hypothetical protein [Aliterella atlantica]
MQRFFSVRAYRAKSNALTIQKHGEMVEAVGKWLQKHSQVVPNYGCEIEEYGLLIQYHAQQSLMYASLLQCQRLYSTYLYVDALQTRLQASKAYTQAVNLYILSIQAYLDCRTSDEC